LAQDRKGKRPSEERLRNKGFKNFSEELAGVEATICEEQIGNAEKKHFQPELGALKRTDVDLREELRSEEGIPA